mgnify:CR=1 FL=1
MSSTAVRKLILDFIAQELPTEKIVDLTAEFQEIKDLREFYNLQPSDPWLGKLFRWIHRYHGAPLENWSERQPWLGPCCCSSCASRESAAALESRPTDPLKSVARPRREYGFIIP